MSKLSSSVGILSKLRYFANMPTLIQFYNSLVNSYLNYALLDWGSAGVTSLKPIKVLQNRAIRFMTRSSRYTRLDIDYINLRILKLEDMYQHSLSKFMYQYHNDNLPKYFQNFLDLTPPSDRVRRIPNPTYRPLHCRKVSTEKSIRFMGPKLWDKLPESIQKSNKALFNKELSNFLLSKY